jgi:DNA replication protein DnaC
MTVQVDFDEEDEQPAAVENGPTNLWWEGQCLFCRKPLRARYWMLMGKPLRPTVHEQCAQRYNKMLHDPRKTVPGDAEIPERFRFWDFAKFPDKHAFSLAQSFDPDSQYKTLAILGNPGKGKSRLMWQVVRQFFEIWAEQKNQSRWVEYYLFSDLMTEYDQSKISKAKAAQFCFIDDLADAPSGRVKAAVQEVVRYRVQSQKWTFLTIDSDKFDPDLLTNVFRERALKVEVQ